MGHTIHLFFPETGGFYIDLVTEDNVVAPLSMNVSWHSLDPSQYSSLMYYAFHFFSFLFFNMTAQSVLLLSSYQRRSLGYSQPVFYQALEWNFLSCFFETSLFIIRPQNSNWPRIAVHCRAGRSTCCCVVLPSLAFVLLGDVGRPEYRSVQLHIVYKQSWDSSGLQFLLGMSVPFALIKIPILLVPPHYSLYYLYCPNHIPV